MADQAELRAALAEAVEASDYVKENSPEDAAEKSWDEWDKDGAPAAPVDEPSKGDPEEAAAAPETDEAQEQELPDEYWGVSLDGIPNDAKKSILDHFAQQDSTIQKLQARLASEPEAPAPVDAPEEEDITDEALLAALGFDPEDWETQQLAPKILPLARTVIDLEDKVDALVQRDQVQEVQTAWNRQLDELEEVQGKLPFSREQVLRYAIEENIGSPYEVYFRIMAPGKREVENTVAKARQEAAKRAESGGVKPRSAGSVSAPIDPKTTSLRDAVAIAMKETEQETGLSFRNLFGRKTKTEE